MTTVAAIVPDLMDRSKISAALPVDVAFVATVDDLAEAQVDVVVVDLRRVDDPAALRRAVPGARIIAFGSHVDENALTAARDAGIDEVLPRSKFFNQIDRWIG